MSPHADRGHFRRKMCGNAPTHDFPQYCYKDGWLPESCPFCAAQPEPTEEMVERLTKVVWDCLHKSDDPGTKEHCREIALVVCAALTAALRGE